MKTEIDVFREYLKENGRRNTPERKIIVEEIFSTHDHFDVDELYNRLKNNKKNVSRVSIYRIIPLLIDSGLIQESYFEDGHCHYEHIFGHQHHCHLRCINCGKILEFREPSITAVEARISKKYNFEVKGHKLEVFGYCSDCNGTNPKFA
ncbi:MAG: transcriptional repressor [Desulfobacterales bacterium]|nr:transcriptional repressor [Desulfobacterales bacterium]